MIADVHILLGEIPLQLRQLAGRVALSAVGAPDAKPEIHIEAGGETERFAANSEPSQLNDGVFLTAEADADAADVTLSALPKACPFPITHGGARAPAASSSGSASSNAMSTSDIAA